MNPDLGWLSDPAVFRVNRRDAHSDHVHYRDEKEAERGRSSFFHSLDGQWDFIWSATPEEREKDFHRPGFRSRRIGKIQVPGHVEIQGHGQVQYINTMYPWEGREMLRPPMVPHDNPVSQYIRRFDLPARMAGQRIILRFDGVECAMYVYLNGQFVGYAEDSFTPSEFEITDLVRERGNRLCVEVYKRSKASWIEDQDFFRFSGIFRPVYLYSIPSCHVDDMWAKTDLMRDESGTFSLRLRLSYGDPSFRGRLEYRLGDLVSGSLDLDASVTSWQSEVFAIPFVGQYHYRAPKLYDFSITVYDDAGDVVEYIPYRIGFNHIEVENGMVMYNYHRLVICGVNRHEWSPSGGRSITLDDMRRDIDLIRQARCNSVRTCHYPDRVEWYSMCDEAGIYVMAETNMESHGSWQKNSAVEPSWNVPGDRPEWKDLVLDRCVSNFELLKNHTSIIFWSLGNESWCGECIQAMNDYYKSADDGRLVHYEGVFHRPEMKGTVSDVESQMYAPPQRVRKYLEKDGSKPFLLCEYMHSMGNSLGGLKEYDDLFDEYLGYVGGYIWDFIDQALYRTDEATGERYFAYGGDFAEKRSDYEFSCNGIVDAERNVKPGFQEVEAVYGNRLW